MKRGLPVDFSLIILGSLSGIYSTLIRRWVTSQRRLVNPLTIALSFLTLTAYSHPVQSPDTLLQTSDSRFIYQVRTMFTEEGEHTTCSIVSISILDKATSQLRQRIKPADNDQDCQQLSSTLPVEDMNFDGYNDIRIRQLMPAAPNVPYYVWLYNPKTSQFVRSSALEEITSPAVDPTHQRIRSAWRANCCDYGEDVYGFIRDQLTLLQQTETTVDPTDSSRTLTTLRRRIKGKMSIVRQITAPIEN